MKKDWYKYLILACVTFGAIWLITSSYNISCEQHRMMKPGIDHIPLIMELLKSKPEFNQVEIIVHTGNGSICVLGVVKDKESFEELRNLVYKTNPPVNVEFLVDISKSEGKE